MPPESPVKTAAPPLINRELSLLAFNRRVLALAQDATVPLLERLRFLCIVSSNLDEFFEIRVAGMREQLRVKAPPPGVTLHELRALSSRLCEQAHALVADNYRTLNEQVLPAMAGAGIRLLRHADRNAGAARLGRRLFPARGQAAADADRARSGAPVSAGRQQEPQFHRRALRAATPSAAKRPSRSSRRRACCRG